MLRRGNWGGSMPACSASSSMADSSEKRPGAAPGAGIDVGEPRFTWVVWWLTSTLGHEYRLRDTPPQFSVYWSVNDVVLIDSWRSDVSLPSASAESRRRCCVSGR